MTQDCTDVQTYPVGSLNKVVRGTNRASYDQNLVHQIIDQAYICHVATVLDGRPVMIPMAHWRVGEAVYIHGSTKNRVLQPLMNGEMGCLCFTHFDGLVMARSAFHHSANYRSVVLYGNGLLVTDPDEKMEHCRLFIEKLQKDRWPEIRPPSKQELKATSIIGFELKEVSAKVRSGDPIDDAPDYDLPVWAGVFPCETKWGEPVVDSLASRPKPE